MRIYGLKDVVADSVQSIALFANNGVALRVLGEAVRGVDMIMQHPHDFHLLCFGDFDDRGLITDALQIPENLGSVADILGSKNGDSTNGEN